MPDQVCAAISGTAGKDAHLQMARVYNHIDPECIASLLLPLFFLLFLFPSVIVVLKACGIILFLLIS